MGFSITPEINKTPMISDDFVCEGTAWDVREDEKTLTVTTGELKLVIDRVCFGLAVYDSGGKLITRHALHDLSGGNDDGPSCDTIPTAILKNLDTDKLSVCELCHSSNWCYSGGCFFESKN